MSTIKIVGLANGEQTPFDGQYVVHYDPGQDSCDEVGDLLGCHLVTTPHQALAKQFASRGEAFECWRSVDPRAPERPDGKPNRPMTALTVEIR